MFSLLAMIDTASLPKCPLCQSAPFEDPTVMPDGKIRTYLLCDRQSHGHFLMVSGDTEQEAIDRWKAVAQK